MKGKQGEASRERLDEGSRTPLSQREIEARISELRARARKGGWGMAAFVLVSILAIPNLNLLPPLPEKIRSILGAAPSPSLISLALVVYVFSALTLTLSRIMQGSGVYRGWSHLFYITSFYVFYGFSGTMQETYWAVFVSGLVILGLENYSIRTFCGEAISEEREKLERMQEEEPRGGT